VYVYVRVCLVLPHFLKEYFLFEDFQVSPIYFDTCVITIWEIGEIILTDKSRSSVVKV